MRLSLARLYLGGFLLLLLIFTAVTHAFYRTAKTEEQHKELFQQHEQARRALASQLINFTNSIRETSQKIATNALTLSSLQAKSDDERGKLINDLQRMFPEAGSIDLIPATELSAKDVYMQSRQEGRVQMIERANKPRRRVLEANLSAATVEPVLDPVTKDLYGFVLVDTDLSRLQNLFDNTPLPNGYAELQQSDGKNYRVLFRRGDENLKANGDKELLYLPGTNWSLAIWSDPQILRYKPQNDATYLVVWAAGVLILGAATFGFYRISQRLIQKDLFVFTKIFSDLLHDRLRKGYRVRLKEFEPSYQLMYRLSKLMLGRNKRVTSSAGIDHLSQVNNRRSFEAKQLEMHKTSLQGWTHTLLILDIDNFKFVNDTYGHDAGDILIVQFGKALRDHLRSSDFIARLGGDEFCVIFPNTPLEKGRELAERLRNSLPKQVELADGVFHQMQWSGGLSEFNRKDKSENLALTRADGALLEAKRAGRNQTQIKAA